jgi:hypothetical protein
LVALEYATWYWPGRPWVICATDAEVSTTRLSDAVEGTEALEEAV